jgi:glycosyltransferase involved in cell wall biosynthesis
MNYIEAQNPNGGRNKAQDKFVWALNEMLANGDLRRAAYYYERNWGLGSEELDEAMRGLGDGRGCFTQKAQRHEGKPSVSIIVTVYNVEAYIEECIQSILGQTFGDFELIIVDDCSPDASMKICYKYARKDRRIKIIHKPRNGGLPQARRTGFEAARGEWIQFVDADDWIEPDMTEQLYRAAVANKSDMVYCNVLVEHEDGCEYRRSWPPLGESRLDNIKLAVFKSPGTSIVMWNKLVKRSIYEKIVFPKENNGEDVFISCQTLFYCNKISHVPFALYHNRFREGSMS